MMDLVMASQSPAPLNVPEWVVGDCLRSPGLMRVLSISFIMPVPSRFPPRACNRASVFENLSMFLQEDAKTAVIDGESAAPRMDASATQIDRRLSHHSTLGLLAPRADFPFRLKPKIKVLPSGAPSLLPQLIGARRDLAPLGRWE
jgi:hypothetical protein